MNTKGLKMIGQGMFSKVYQLDEKRVLIQSSCKVKDALAWDYHTSFKGIFPELQREESEQFVCEYYPRVKSLKAELRPDHYEVYKNLRLLSVGAVTNNHEFYFLWKEKFKEVKNAKFRKALLDMVDALSNYGSDMNFEISPRNVAVKNGKLILLDVFYFVIEAERIRFASRKKSVY